MSTPQQSPLRTAGSGGLRRVRVIDGFRAYAIAGVVLIHLLLLSGALTGTEGTARGIAAWGLLGNVIDVFFIASGFVLFLPLVAAGGRVGSLRQYAAGRAIRLLPTYWLTLAVLVVLLALAPTGAREAQLPGVVAAGVPDAGSILTHLLALQMPARMTDDGFLVGFGVDGPLWMISVIVGFYVVLPIVAGAYARRPLLGLAAALAVTVAWKEGVGALGPALADLQGGGNAFFAQLVALDQLPGWAFSFALGMTGAWAYARFGAGPLGRRGRRVLLGAAFAALVVFGACAYEYGSRASEVNAAFSGGVARLDTWLGVAYSASRAVLMGAIALGPFWLQRPFANRPVGRLAELSYGLYVIHIPVAVYLGSMVFGLPTGRPADLAVWLAVVVPASLAYAYLGVRFIERPARRRWRERRRARTPAQPAPPGSQLPV